MTQTWKAFNLSTQQGCSRV